MASPATQVRRDSAGYAASWSWFREFIRWEVASYPGRVNAVIRMTVTATLIMFIVETFRIPNAFLAALYAILLARENLAATWRGGRILLLGFVGASLYTLMGMMLFRDYPITHFFWVIGSLYLVFFVIRITTNYAAAAAFAIPIGIALPLWDRSLPSQAQVEGTLWPVLIIAVGAGVTVAAEALYRIFDRTDPLVVSVDDMLLAVQEVVESIAAHRAPPESIVSKISQYQMTGTGRLRVTLLRQGIDPTRRAQRSALISFARRLIDLASALEHTPSRPGDDDAARLRSLSDRLGEIRTALREPGGVTAPAALLEGQPSPDFPMLQEMERIIAIITGVLQPDAAVSRTQNCLEPQWWRSIFLPDALENPEYQRFALAGCLAATVCYVLYNALDWPGIGQTCVITCIVTALSTIGNSLQAQFLRLAGFVAGGLVMGISAQVLILPSLDSIFGFAVFFAAGTAIAAWFATSSPRLSYFGVQMALSFYFVNLQDPHIQTDLTVARDKVMGVLLGILAMGFIFDRFGSRSDAEQLQKLLVGNVRLLAQLGVSPQAVRDRVAAGAQVSRLRSQINDNFASLESQMDAARFEFEFRHRREDAAVECGRIQRVQPGLRSIFLLELSLLSHREQLVRASGLTQGEAQELDEFLKHFSDELLHIAAWIAEEEEAPAHISRDSLKSMRQSFENQRSPGAGAVADICEKMTSALLTLQAEC